MILYLALSSEQFLLNCKDPSCASLRRCNKWQVALPWGRKVMFSINKLQLEGDVFVIILDSTRSLQCFSWGTWCTALFQKWAWKKYIYNCTDLTAVSYPQSVLLADFSEHFLHLEKPSVHNICISCHIFYISEVTDMGRRWGQKWIHSRNNITHFGDPYIPYK